MEKTNEYIAVEKDGKKYKKLTAGYRYSCEGFDFIIHKWGTKGKPWRATELTTGLCFHDAETRQRAAEFIETRIKNIGAERFGHVLFNNALSSPLGSLEIYGDKQK